MSKDGYVSYEESGVNIDSNEQMVKHIHSSLRRRADVRAIGLANGFAGLFQLDFYDKHELLRKNYINPVLVACSDGVGTKVIIAQDMKKFDTVGIDLVAMSVNDMIVHGAEPLFFLDYIAVNNLIPLQIAEMVDGIANGCELANCTTLLGGETAEMPDIYKKDEFDMAGFAVGVVEKRRVITGKGVKKGDVILGLASNGLHSNGFSLVRNICFKKLKLKVTDTIDQLDGRQIGDVLLEPTRIYVKPVIKLLSRYKVKKVVRAMAHITGGGLVGNIPRVLPKNCNAVIRKSSWQVPPIFSFLQDSGPVEEEEMFRVFNMGIGFVLIVAPDFARSISAKLKKYGEKVYRLGTITAGSGKVILK